MFTKIILVSLLVFLGVFSFESLPSDSVSYPANNICPYVDQQLIQENRIISKWIDNLEEYECKNCPVGYSRIDSNNKISYGCLQFQMATFKQFFTRYFPDVAENMNESDWENQIHDCFMQKKVAYKMLEEDTDRWTHWRTSTERGLGILSSKTN